MKFYIFDGAGAWRALDIRNGHVEGRGPAKFAYLKGGKLVLVGSKKILKDLEDLKEGKDSAVKYGSRLPFIRVKHQDREKHGERSSCNHSHCCPNISNGPQHPINAAPRVRSASIQTEDASIQTSLTLLADLGKSANNAVTSKTHQTRSENSVTLQNLPSNSSANKVMTHKRPEANSKPAQATKRRQSVAYSEQPKKKRRLSLLRNKSLPKHDKLEVIAKTPTILDDKANVPVKSLTGSTVEVILNDKDIDLIGRFFMKHSKNFNLHKFNEGDHYQIKCLCMLTPIIQIERSKEIYKILRKASQDSQYETSQKKFVSHLGLRAVSEKSAPEAPENSIFDGIRHTRKNDASKSYFSSSEDEVVSKRSKNKNETEVVDLTQSESDNEQNDKPKVKITLKRDKRGTYRIRGKNTNNLTTSAAKNNQIKESSTEISDSDNVNPPRRIQTRRSTINILDKDALALSRLRKRPNKTERINYSENSEDEFVISPSKNKNVSKTNNKSENKKQRTKVIKESIVINDENSESENRNDKNNNTTDTEDISVNETKRPQRKVKQFKYLSGSVNDESNFSTINKSSEVYFSDESDQDVEKNITRETKSISKNHPSIIKFNRQYSNLEDHAIVSWVSNGSRASSVNGNHIWKELAEQYYNITRINRSWHSLRNRYLRYILPRLESMALDSVLVSRLRAAAATGQIKSCNMQAPRRNSIFGLPTRGALSRRAKRVRSEDSPPTRKLDKDVKPLPSTSSVRVSLVTSPEKSTRSPRYSEITRRFAQKYRKDTDSSTPATSRRNSTESEEARRKSPEAKTSRRKSTDTRRSARNLAAAKRSNRDSLDISSPSKTVSNSSQRRSLRNRSVSQESPAATVKNRRKSLKDKFEENKSESATKSRRKSVKDRLDDSNSPVATTSTEKSPKSATKSRRMSLIDESEDSKSPVLSKPRQKLSGPATNSRDRRDRFDSSKSPVTKIRQKSPQSKDKFDGQKSPVLTTSATKNRRNSLPDRFPLLTSSQKSRSRTKTRKLYNSKAGV